MNTVKIVKISQIYVGSLSLLIALAAVALILTAKDSRIILYLQVLGFNLFVTFIHIMVYIYAEELAGDKKKEQVE